MKRRGLNFITDNTTETMDDEQIATLENEVDNVAPKIVGILALSDSCDISGLRKEMVKHCLEYQQGLQKISDEEIERQIKEDNQFRAYLCPNPGSSTNMGSKKQRLIFVEIDRTNPLAVLEVGKIADIIVVVMSCGKTDIQGLKMDPDQHSHAIDDQGYKALGLLRSQGLPALIGVLQHLEVISSKRQPQIKRLFERYFVSEFTDKHKFMNVNLANTQTDFNALLRQIAVLYPAEITWRQNRSYMLGKLTKVVQEDVKELHFEGYIRQNVLNVKRLVHITGIHPQAFKIKRIEVARDPCAVKISQKEKDKVMSTSKAQSLVSSRRNSMDVSRSSIVMDSTNRVIQGEANLTTDNPRDSEQCENTPSPFAAEQAIITEEEIKQSQ